MQHVYVSCNILPLTQISVHSTVLFLTILIVCFLFLNKPINKQNKYDAQMCHMEGGGAKPMLRMRISIFYFSSP